MAQCTIIQAGVPPSHPNTADTKRLTASQGRPPVEGEGWEAVAECYLNRFLTKISQRVPEDPVSATCSVGRERDGRKLMET